MTLPTREEAQESAESQESAECCDWIGNSDGHAIVAAYAGGHLHTNDEVREIVAKARVEWEATIDYDEMAGWLQDTAENEGAISPDDVRIILAAAVSEDNDAD